VASLARVPGVANAEVSGEKHTATVVFDDQKTTVAAPISATTNAGYARKPHHESV
jgi:periplasmic mercuric ion binding protein